MLWAAKVWERAVIVTTTQDDGRDRDQDRVLARRRLEEELPTLRLVARRLYHNRADADDLVQDVLERALRSLHKLDLESNPRGWLVTILHHLHVDRCRQQARRSKDVSSDDIALASPEAAPEPFWAKVTGAQLLEAVELLGDELRATYELFALQGRSYREVATALGIPTSTVGTRLLRAREQLKLLLTKKQTGRST